MILLSYKRRAQRYDSSRQLDILASLNLGFSDEEQDDEDNIEIVPDGISQFAAMLPPATSSEPLPTPGRKKRSKKRKNKNKAATNNEEAGKTPHKKLKTQWADKCMYAELLEMKTDAAWSHIDDGLPDDLELGWIAVGGVPVGKRCLAITYHSSGVSGSS
jgi:snurportin-1